MYGGLAHANDDKKLQYEEWMQGPFASIFQFSFENIAANIVQKVVSFYTMNERTISLLEAAEVSKQEQAGTPT